MAIKIYGRLSSANVQKINWFCNYANVSVVNLNYGGIHGKTQTNKFKEMNPNSRVPVLEDNNFILYESNAILRYLSKKYNILFEKKIEINGKIDQWIDWGSFTFASPCSLLTANKLSPTGGITLPISIHKAVKIPRWTGSTPSANATGK